MKLRQTTTRKPPKQAYEEGVQAFFKGTMDNPYKPRTYYWKEWNRGFDTAYFKNLAISA